MNKLISEQKLVANNNNSELTQALTNFTKIQHILDVGTFPGSLSEDVSIAKQLVNAFKASVESQINSAKEEE